MESTLTLSFLFIIEKFYDGSNYDYIILSINEKNIAHQIM